MERRKKMLLLVLLGMVAWAALGTSRVVASVSPYFQYFGVFADNNDTVMKTSLDVTIIDPDGSVPGTIASVTVAGPDGFYYSFVPEDYQGGTSNEYWHSQPGLPVEGNYTFTVTDIDGNTATTYFTLIVGQSIPVPDASTYRASGANPLTPTLSWGAIQSYPGNLYYRAKVLNLDDTTVWSSARTFNTTSVTVPSDVLVDGQSYKWRVDAYDDFSIQTWANRSMVAPIPLTITNTHPYFISVAAFTVHNSNGSLATGLYARGDNPAGSISSLVITDPNNTKYTYSGPAVSCFTSSTTCGWTLSAAPVTGLYTFEVTNTSSESAISSFYLDPYTVPLIDPGTMHASGNSLTPVLSWSTPAAIDRPFYYVVFVRDASSKTTVWSNMVTQNAVSVPQGKLEAGKSYEWQVAPNDGYELNFTNRSFSGWKTLDVKDSSPFFWSANVLDRNQASGDFSYLSVSVRDANGVFPGNLKSLTVTGPGGFSYSFQPEDYFAPDNSLYHSVPGSPPRASTRSP